MGNADLNVFDVHRAVPGLQHCLELYTRGRTLSGEVKLQLGHQNRQAESIVKQQQQHLHLKPHRRNAILKTPFLDAASVSRNLKAEGVLLLSKAELRKPQK